VGIEFEKFVPQHREISLKMNYRGPDITSELIYDKGALFISELKITNYRNSIQPFTTKSNNVTIILNGQIYNYKELKSKLNKLSIQLNPNTDTEVLAYLYEIYGEECLEFLDGMYAFAIYDHRDDSLLLARDRFGEKPLFYTETNQIIHFCTEANFLIPFTDKNIDQIELVEYLVFGFSFNHLISGIKRVKPGSFIKITSKTLSEIQYWKPILTPDYKINLKDVLENCYEIIKKEVFKRLPENLDFGMYISGGIDSSLISRILVDFKIDFKFFTSGIIDIKPLEDIFSQDMDPDFTLIENEINELKYVSFLTHTTDMPVQKNTFTVRDFINCLPDMIKHLPGGPVLNTAFPLLYFTSSISKEYRVCFSGEGADELLGGYKTSQPEYYTNSISRSFLQLTENFTTNEVSMFLGKNSVDLLNKVCIDIDNEISNEFGQKNKSKDIVFNKVRYFMLRYVFCPHILEKSDGMTMGKGPTELRMPYLSNDFSDYCLKLPLSLCRFNNIRKYPLNAIGERIGVPKEIINRKHKQRTSLPYYNLIYRNNEFREYIQSIFTKKALICDILQVKNPWKYLTQIDNSPNAHRRIWSLLILEIWLRKVINS